MQLSFTSLEQELEQLRRENKDIENVCYFIVWLFSIKRMLLFFKISVKTSLVYLCACYAFKNIL